MEEVASNNSEASDDFEYEYSDDELDRDDASVDFGIKQGLPIGANMVDNLKHAVEKNDALSDSGEFKLVVSVSLCRCC